MTYKFGDSRLPTRFWSKVRQDEGGCWVWIASRLPAGYGQINIDGRPRRSHRVAYEALVGDLPPWSPDVDGLVLDHLCRNPPCVNPTHLEVVTNRVNMLRGESPYAKKARRTHCPAGHPLVQGNLRSDTPRRSCQSCRDERGRLQSALIRDAHTALGISQRDYKRIYGASMATARALINEAQS